MPERSALAPWAIPAAGVLLWFLAAPDAARPLSWVPLLPICAGLALGFSARIGRARASTLVQGAVTGAVAVVVCVEPALASVNVLDEPLLPRAHAVLIIHQASFVPLALLALGLRPQAVTFAYGATALGLLFHQPGALAALVFLMARDTGEWAPGFSLRQALSLLGSGVLAHIFMASLSFDGMTHAARSLPLGPADTRYVDAPTFLVLRVSLELFFLLATLAHARGRTWGVLALLLLAPWVPVATYFYELPWVTSGCMHLPHPLDYATLYCCAWAVAVVPWIFPVARAMKGARSSEGCQIKASSESARH